MKTIGLLGGTSWPSTIEYYRILNELAQARLGGHHSARLLLSSIDYHEIKSRYYARWDEIPALLRTEIESFASLATGASAGGPQCLVICNNTLHKAYDSFASELDLGMPVFHVVRETGAHAAARGYRHLLLLGTQFTMEDGFYHRGLEAFGLRVSTPREQDRVGIQEVQTQLARGVMRPEFRQYFLDLVERYSDVDAVVLGCTELPLAMAQGDYALPLINPTQLQCIAAFEYAVAP
jgi:aspartate racemase